MGVELLTDRVLITRILEASEGLDEHELVAFASMQERLVEDNGVQLTAPQRLWAEETFARLKLSSLPPDEDERSRIRRKRGRKYVAAADRPPGEPVVHWWDGSDPNFHPLKPPPGPKPWTR